MKNVLLSGAMALLASPVFAGATDPSGSTVQNLQIINISPAPVLTFTTDTHHFAPGCSVVSPGWAIRLDDAGKQIYTLILSAQENNKAVLIVGSNLCNDWPNKESIQTIQIID